MARTVESVCGASFIYPFSPHHVVITVKVTITKTGTITMTNKQLIQDCFPYLNFMLMYLLNHVVKAQL